MRLVCGAIATVAAAFGLTCPAFAEGGVPVEPVELSTATEIAPVRARPTDPPVGEGRNRYPRDAPVANLESANFCVFWVTDPAYADAPDLTDGDLDGVPDYPEKVLEFAEYARSIEVAPGPLGWVAPKPDKEGCGADPSVKADIYLMDIDDEGANGYQMADPGQGDGRTQYGYVVIDNGHYRARSGDPLAPLAATIAHEYAHMLQGNYDDSQEAWVGESTATWVEQKVIPVGGDYVDYVANFSNNPNLPVTTESPNGYQGLRIYGTAVWNHWLDSGGGGFGADTIRRVWEVSAASDPPLGVAAYDQAIRDAGGPGFSREWAEFATATAEWRTGFGGFPDASEYPEVKREGELRAGRTAKLTLDHTAYRLMRITSPSETVELSLKVKGKVRAALAIVARKGGDTTGKVTQKFKYLGNGGAGKVVLRRADQYERITAVVVNADERTSGFGEGNWVYSGDGAKFAVTRR